MGQFILFYVFLVHLSMYKKHFRKTRPDMPLQFCRYTFNFILASVFCMHKSFSFGRGTIACIQAFQARASCLHSVLALYGLTIQYSGVCCRMQGIPIELTFSLSVRTRSDCYGSTPYFFKSFSLWRAMVRLSPIPFSFPLPRISRR